MSERESIETKVRRSPRIAALAAKGGIPDMVLSTNKFAALDPKKAAKKKKKKTKKESKEAPAPAPKAAKVKKSKKTKKALEPEPEPAPVKKKKKRSRESADDAAPAQKKLKTAAVVEEVKEAPVETVVEYRAKHNITFKAPTGFVVPDPVRAFSECKFAPEIHQALDKAGFDAPSPIQAETWKLSLAGQDVIGVAKTGSGKTCGFLLPGFMRILNEMTARGVRRGDGPMMLVLAPTRELAIQIEVECVKFAETSRLVSVCLYGGAPKGPQIRRCMMGVHIAIATPGRLNDLLQMNAPPVTNLSRCKYLVLDEADRMLDMGFEPQIRQIIDQIPAGRQTLMFTATWPKAVQKLAREFLKVPIQVNIGNQDQLNVNKDVKQQILKVGKDDKEEKIKEILKGILEEDKNASIIIFSNQKRLCDHLAYICRRSGWSSTSIHGDKEQWEREQCLGRFTAGIDKVIVATDVAARGLDIKGVSHVVNYDFPLSGVEDWVHRVGRTGRAGATGKAITFFDPSKDRRSATELVQVLTEGQQEIPAWLAQMGAAGRRGGHGHGGSGFRRYGGGHSRGRGRGGHGRGRGRSFRY